MATAHSDVCCSCWVDRGLTGEWESETYAPLARVKDAQKVNRK